jgi:predicted signal transduction protein with EAL and GGDEF domain
LPWLQLFRELKRRSEAEDQLAVLASTDPLTGLSNWRHFNEALEREWRRAAREETPVALFIIDIDLFKDYNDRHGHQAGDQLLQGLSKHQRCAEARRRYRRALWRRRICRAAAGNLCRRCRASGQSDPRGICARLPR